MYRNRIIPASLFLLILPAILLAQGPLPRQQWGAPVVDVTESNGIWTIAGKKQTVLLNQKDLSVQIKAGSVNWNLVRSSKDDMLVKYAGEEFYLRLADAGRIEIESYDTGYKTGVQLKLQQFRANGLVRNGSPLDLTLYLTMALEGRASALY